MTGWRPAGRALVELYPRGIALLWLAPAVIALVAIPEFLQHVAEIQLGMFDDRESFREHAQDPRRMMFGYAKIAGLVLTMLAAARFWWARGHDARWWDVRSVAWKRLGLGFLLFMLLPSLPGVFNDQFGKPAMRGVSLAMTVLLLPALFLMLAGLYGDRRTSQRAIWRRSWPWAMLTLLLLVAAFLPSQWLHQMNHKWAIGAAVWAVWALMIFDSLLVGLLAGLVGTAFYLGYTAFADGEGQRSGLDAR